MSTTTATTAPATTTRTRVPSWRFGLATGVLAAAATAAVVAAARAVGVPPEVDGESIPILGFVQMVLLGTVIGIVMARRLRTSTFVRATVVLTAVSCIPSLAFGTGLSSKLVLVLTHVVAATIVVPRLASRMDR
jgi:hypothetical protein